MKGKSFEARNRLHSPSRWPVDGALRIAYVDLAFLDTLKKIGVDIDRDKGCQGIYEAASRIVFKRIGKQK